MRITQIICLILAFLPSAACAQGVNGVRVAILQDAPSINIKIAGSYEIADAKQRILQRGRDLKTTVTSYKRGILIAGKNFNLEKILIKTINPGIIIINGRTFRGDIQLIKTGGFKLTVINRIGLEDYVQGILYHEASHYWPMEALKAQAIVSRTYAVYQSQENSAKDFDVTSDIYSQVYGGKTSERERTNKAVEETAAKVLTYQDKIIPAYFHATCGGHTQDASRLWNINLFPLKGVPCDFCKGSPHYNWHYVARLDEIEEKLANSGYKTGNIKDIAVLGKDKSGRITDLRIAALKKEIKISAKDFRNIMGPDIIKSTDFNLKLVDKDAVFEGLGWGHGVGLCQWGAYFMSKQGYGYEKILQYYYPGTDVKTIGL
ncbi:MAG: SpoIID/LytB domain-containing protein [Candidatus Omnitrophota bacterium]